MTGQIRNFNDLKEKWIPRTEFHYEQNSEAQYLRFPLDFGPNTRDHYLQVMESYRRSQFDPNPGPGSIVEVSIIRRLPDNDNEYLGPREMCIPLKDADTVIEAFHGRDFQGTSPEELMEHGLKRLEKDAERRRLIRRVERELPCLLGDLPKRAEAVVHAYINQDHTDRIAGTAWQTVLAIQDDLAEHPGLDRKLRNSLQELENGMETLCREDAGQITARMVQKVDETTSDPETNISM